MGRVAVLSPLEGLTRLISIQPVTMSLCLTDAWTRRGCGAQLGVGRRVGLDLEGADHWTNEERPLLDFSPLSNSRRAFEATASRLARTAAIALAQKGSVAP